VALRREVVGRIEGMAAMYRERLAES